MITVVDASVAAKWFLAPVPEEGESDLAMALLEQAVNGPLRLWQPPHFVAEMASVLARLKPTDAEMDLRDLMDIEFERIDDDQLYVDAMELAIRLDHHVFDTLYHALALSVDQATLITADRRYYRKARHLGRITLLSHWTPGQP